MDGGNCSSITGFIFLGITHNTEDKVTTFTMVLTADLIGHLANLGMLLLIKIDLQLHTPMCSFLSHPLYVSQLFHCSSPQDALRPIFQDSKTYFLFGGCCCPILRLLYLCRLWVSRSGSDGPWLVQSHQQPLPLWSQQVQQGGLPAHGWGFPGGNDRCSDTHGISIPLMFLCVKWD